MQFRHRDDLLTRVASLYYEFDYSQQEIADKLRISRSNISRLLKEAKKKGLVEIRIRHRIPRALELETALAKTFNLQQAMVVDAPDSPYEELLAGAGQLAAWHLEEILRPMTVIGISWGTGVSAAVTAVNPLFHLQIDVIQMIGSVGTISSVIDGPELARTLSAKLGGNYYYLHAPLFVSDRTMRDALLQQPTIIETLQRARAAQVAIVGIGTTAPGASSFLRARHLTEEQVAELRVQGVVGETAGWHFDIHGNADFDINHRVIALQLHELKEIPNVIAVACGQAKTHAILGVLRGGYLSALATDATTARAVLELASSR
jgi:DNA-binding transcriptional regulator LsrR (DeoR family)